MLIIGYGNPLRGDDAMGLVAAERLGGMAVHQLTPEMAEVIAQHELVVFLDADVTLPPGEVAVKRAERDEGVARGPGGPPYIDHFATPEGLLALALMVYGHAPGAWLIGMGGECFDLREGLSAAAAGAVNRAVEAAARLTTTPL